MIDAGESNIRSLWTELKILFYILDSATEALNVKHFRLICESFETHLNTKSSYSLKTCKTCWEN